MVCHTKALAVQRNFENQASFVAKGFLIHAIFSGMFSFIHFSALRIREHGIQLREKSRVMISKPKCDSDGKNFGSVRLIDCYAALMVLVYGFCASLLTFGAELLAVAKLNKMCRVNPRIDKEEIEKE